MCGFIAQLVEHRTGIAEVTGSNPVEALIFFRLLLSNCLNWKIYYRSPKVYRVSYFRWTWKNAWISAVEMSIFPFFQSSFSTKRLKVHLLTADFSAFYRRYVEFPWDVQRFLSHNNLEGNKLTLKGEYIGRLISCLQINTNNVTVHQK